MPRCVKIIKKIPMQSLHFLKGDFTLSIFTFSLVLYSNLIKMEQCDGICHQRLESGMGWVSASRRPAGGRACGRRREVVLSKQRRAPHPGRE